jgi:hypothetical protein
VNVMRAVLTMVVATCAAACGLVCSSAGAMAAPLSGRLAIAPVSGMGLVIVAADGRDARRVCVTAAFFGSCPWVSDPHWSADGREFAFSTPSACADSGCRPVVTVGTPTGTCVDCSSQSSEALIPLGNGADPTFYGDRGLIDAVASGSLRVETLMGRSQGVLARGGVTAGAVSRRGVIAVARAHDIWVGRAGQLRRIGPGAAPVWSATGSRLAYVRAGWVVLEEGRAGRVRKLARGSSPSWSPDGRQIAYVGPGHGIMEVSVATTRARRVGGLRGRAVAWGASPSPPRCQAPIGVHALSAGAGGHLYEANIRAGLGQTLVGCLDSDGVARVLTTLGIPNEDSAYHFTQTMVNGQFAAVIVDYVDQHYGVGTSQYLEVFDLASGRLSPTLGGERVLGSLDDLVVNGSGDTAVHATFNYGSDATETILASTTSGVQTIATAPANATDTNLNLTGLVLTYTNAGIPQSTVLP